MTSGELNDIRQTVYNILNEAINAKQYGLFCDLHDAQLYDGDASNDHNCIGCNLDEYSQVLVNALKVESEFKSEYELFSRFVVNAYILNERIRVYTKILSFDDATFNAEFPTLRSIMKWANFIKHPKAFMLVHSPNYTFDNSADKAHKLSQKNYTIIDQAFIEHYYSGPGNNAGLYATLTNQKDVLVIFPEMSTLSNVFSEDCKKFIKMILDTKAYRDILKDKTTIANYFSEQDEE